jgi:hypothetical protein
MMLAKPRGGRRKKVGRSSMFRKVDEPLEKPKCEECQKEGLLLYGVCMDCWNFVRLYLKQLGVPISVLREDYTEKLRKSIKLPPREV